MVPCREDLSETKPAIHLILGKLNFKHMLWYSLGKIMKTTYFELGLQFTSPKECETYAKIRSRFWNLGWVIHLHLLTH